QDGFVSTYADIVYTKEIAKAVAESPHGVTLGCDTDWRRRYEGRSQHPETDAEKLVADGERVVKLSRRIASEEASGEFIGVMKVSRERVPELLSAFDKASAQHGGKVYREGRTFEKAYLIDFLADRLESGDDLHRANTHGGYMEIDTLEDRSLAEKWWTERAR
ncbi:MAG: phosphocholine cytidylyltransferase family protein, partial [Polyangiaceae bacterium]